MLQKTKPESETESWEIPKAVEVVNNGKTVSVVSVKAAILANKKAILELRKALKEVRLKTGQIRPMGEEGKSE